MYPIHPADHTWRKCVTLSDGSIRNAYDLRLRNREGQTQEVTLRLTGPEGLALSIEGAEGAMIPVAADSQRQIRAYVTAAPEAHAASRDRSAISFTVEDLATGETAEVASSFNGDPK